MLTDLGFEHNSLKELILSISTTSCDARFCEVHNLEDVLSVFASIAHPKVEPLLVATRVSIDLHVQAILARGDAVGSEQVATLKYGVDEKDITVVFPN